MTHQKSFLIILTFVFLLPLFFIPGGILPLPATKAVLATLFVIAASLVFFYELWRSGAITLPKYPLLIVVACLPAVYLFSAILAIPPSLALLGYNLEQGTFGFVLLGSALLLLTSFVFSENSRVLKALTVFLVSFSIIAIFTTIKILVGGDFLALGNFFGNMGSPLGSWTDLAMGFGLLAVFTALIIGMLPLTFLVRTILYVVFTLSTALLVIINFSAAFVITLVLSALLWLYFVKIEKGFLYTQEEGVVIREKGRVLLPIILGVISLIFLINPTISETKGKLGRVVSSTVGVDNIDVRPSLSATLSISKQVLSLSSFLGSGPNTFGYNWLIYKPVNVNTTPFWAVAFPYGIGFLPTQIATTGILGSLLWLAFIVFLLVLAVRVLGRIPESRASRFTLISSLLLSVFLWTSTLFYVPSMAMLFLAFFFVGLFIATSRETGVISSKTIELRSSTQHRFVSIVLVGALSLGALWFVWLGAKKTVATYHFQKAIVLANTTDIPIQDVEDAVDKALQYASDDKYLTALARVNFLKAQRAVSAEANTSAQIQENQRIFQESLSKSIAAARKAADVNPSSYENWVVLGVIYSALVPAPLSVDGAYENALYAYNEARKRNPNNPELHLLLAQLELNHGNVEQARSHIRSSIALKNDYADAYFALTQLEIAQGNTEVAIASTEQLALLMRNNPGVYFGLGFLKYSTGDYDGAEEALLQALNISPDYANAKYYLGLSLASLGREDEARIQFEELLTTNPDSAELKQALESLGN